MKKTQRIDLLTTIKGSIVSFFAITMFVALGVGLFLGIHWLGTSMHNMFDEKFAEGNMHALEITFPYGLTKDDLAELSEVEGVDEVEAGYLSFQEFEHEGATLVTRVGTLPQSIDLFVSVEGTLPTRANEIAISEINAEQYGIKIGDTITFTSDAVDNGFDANLVGDAFTLDIAGTGTEAEGGEATGEGTGAETAGDSSDGATSTTSEAASTTQEDTDGMRYLNGGTYTVTALVKSPAYLARYNGTYGVASVGTGTIHVLAWVCEEAFDPSAYQEGKPYVLVASRELSSLSYSSDEYKQRSSELEERVTTLGTELGTARYAELHTNAEQRLAEAEEKLADGEQRLADGEQQYQDGQAELERRKAEAEAQLAAARARLASAQAQYDAGEQQLAEGRAQLARARELYAEAQAKFAAVETIVNNSKVEYQAIQAEHDAEIEAFEDERAAAYDAFDKEMEAAYDALNGTEDAHIIDETELAAYYTAISEHPEWDEDDLSEEQEAARQQRIDEILDADDAYNAAVERQMAAGERLDAEREARMAELDAEYSSEGDQPNQRTEEIEARYNAKLDALGASIEAQLAEQDITLPVRIDHTNLAYISYPEEFIEQAKNYEIDYNGYRVSYNTAAAFIAENQDKVDAAQARLNSAYQQITSGRNQYAAAVARMEEEVAQAEQRLANAEQQLEQGRDTLERGRVQIEHGREQLTSMEEYGWVVLPRAYNGGVIFADAMVQVMGNLRWSMASLFLIVGILVCYSAVSRLVHEQITRIGTKKAVGFREGEINALFLCYAALCVALGAVIGAIMGYVLVEPIILRTLNTRFAIACAPAFSLPESALMAALEFVLILGSTWVAVRSVLKMQAVELLAGEKPPTAKARFYESWGVWKRMGLLAQTTINNCINDTRRVVGTLVGVSGCTALIVCAMMLNDNVLRSFTRQYDAINHYDVVVNVVKGSDAANRGEQAIEAAGLAATAVQQQSLSLDQPDGKRAIALVVVPMDEDDYGEFFTVIPTSETVEATDGILMSQAYSEHLGAKPGDNLTLSNSRGDKFEIPITGFFEYHLSSNQALLTNEAYEHIFGDVAEANRILVRTDGAGVEAVEKALSGMDGVISVSNNYASDRKNFDDFAALSRIMVLVYLALATVMAACVLLNLDFMFVDEKKREIIVLMINGYSLKEAKGYIWHDSVVLTALGIICGLVLGNVVGGFTVLSAEQANTSFMHDISWVALGAGVAGSVVLAAAALIVALRRISKFDLTDINRF